MSLCQGSFTLTVDAQVMADNFRSICTDLARLLKRFPRKSRLKTAISTYDASVQSSDDTVEEKSSILRTAVSKTASFVFNPRRP